MEKFVFNTPKGQRTINNADEAAKYKTYCENQGWGLIAHGGNIWDGWLFVYAK